MCIYIVECIFQVPNIDNNIMLFSKGMFVSFPIVFIVPYFSITQKQTKVDGEQKKTTYQKHTP